MAFRALPNTLTTSGAPVRGPLMGGLLAMLFASALAGCGGGGGGADSQAQSSAPPPSPAPAPPPESTLVDDADAFHFTVSDAIASDAALGAIADGQALYASWDPVAGPMLTPGMKVNFFGRAPQCAAGLQGGPVVISSNLPDASSLAAMGLASTSGFVRDWQPSGNSSDCAPDAQQARGPSHVTLQVGASAATIGLMTVAAGTAGSPAFFGPYDAAGQNGAGANAFNTSSFVTFRMDFTRVPRRPWVPSVAGGSAVARIFTRQSISSVVATAPAGATLPVQAKQFISVQFINNACASGGTSAARPCGVKFLMPTAIAQAGVTDWSGVGWFGKARVWFDPAQGGMPIVEAAPPAKGGTIDDADSGLPMYTSAGDATGHGAFQDSAFDVRVSFAQLQNVMRIVAARRAGTKPALVADADVANVFGPSWADPTQWALVTVAVGQEVHNPYADGVASIGGHFRSVYVGPQS